MHVHPAFRTSRERALRLLYERSFGAFAVPTAVAPTAVQDNDPLGVVPPSMVFRRESSNP